MCLFLWVVNSTPSLLLLTLDGFLDILVILSAILLPIKSPVASAIFWIALFEAVVIASVVDFSRYQDVFGYIYYLNFYPYF